MFVTMSNYLTDQKPAVKKLVEGLSRYYGYVSVLGTDTVGTQYSVQRGSISIEDSGWSERGFVARVHNGINYSEFSFNKISEDSLEELIDEIRSGIEKTTDNLRAIGTGINSYPVIQEENIIKGFLGEIKIHPEEVSAEDKIRRMTAIKDNALRHSELLVNFIVSYEEVQVSKIFISGKKELEQSYVWSQGSIVPIVRRGNDNKYTFKAFSGLKGVELLDEMEDAYGEAIDEAVKLLDSKKVIPGEYDVICSPEITGLIAHEAFGHGVEMDMFVKNRAKAVEYLGKQIASDIVTMHDGAAAAKDISSYLFDDEGIMGTDTKVIENGILKTGISDLLSAMKLGTKPTGNGKRQSFERKAYARMTNTFFAPGKDKLEDMISSIKFGYLIDGMMSGMEDPKNWGIQCVAIQGKEIVDGRFTGNIVSPVIMVGYVPDLLKSISMVSEEMELFGAGACGKGYKEFVKVTDGGPYIKARVRLG